MKSSKKSHLNTNLSNYDHSKKKLWELIHNKKK